MTMTPESEDQRCTRIAAATKARCRHPRTHWSVLSLVTSVPLPGPDPQSCWDHLTSEERRILEDAREMERSILALAALPADADPACWSWEPTTKADMEQTKASVPQVARDHIREEDWAELLLDNWQGGQCAICGKRKPLVTDHDHRSGLIRGLLCRSCNILEGMGREGVFAKYRELNPAIICGMLVRYQNPVTMKYAEPAPPHDQWTDNPLKGAGL